MVPDFVNLQFTNTYAYLFEQVLDKVDWADVWTLLKTEEQQYAGSVMAYSVVLPVFTCMAVGGKAETAVPVAAAWVLSELAARLFDDLQDQDKQHNIWNQWPLAKTLPVGLGLLFAAETCLTRLPILATAKIDILTQINEAGIYAARGQAKPMQDDTLTTYFNHVISKAGLMVATYCYAGARLHTNSTEQLQTIYDFGLTLGTLMQLNDDIRDSVDDG